MAKWDRWLNKVFLTLQKNGLEQGSLEKVKSGHYHLRGVMNGGPFFVPASSTPKNETVASRNVIKDIKKKLRALQVEEEIQISALFLGFEEDTLEEILSKLEDYENFEK